MDSERLSRDDCRWRWTMGRVLPSGTVTSAGEPRFHALLGVSDHRGNWQTAQQPFTMRQRGISVVLDQIHIIGDGADGDTTESFKGVGSEWCPSEEPFRRAGAGHI